MIPSFRHLSWISDKKNVELPPNQSSVCLSWVFYLRYLGLQETHLYQLYFRESVLGPPNIYTASLKHSSGNCRACVVFYYLLQILVKCCFVSNIMKYLFQESVILFQVDRYWFCGQSLLLMSYLQNDQWLLPLSGSFQNTFVVSNLILKAPLWNVNYFGIQRCGKVTLEEIRTNWESGLKSGSSSFIPVCLSHIQVIYKAPSLWKSSIKSSTQFCPI